MDLQLILSCFKGVKQCDKGYMALCPAHNDNHPSLSIGLSEDKQKILIHCFAGCSTEDILKKVGLSMSDLYEYKTESVQKAATQTVYKYYSAENVLLYEKIRLDYANGQKTFYFCKPDGTKNINGVQRIPYHLPEILTAETVYFVEGEKCADAVIKAGRVATTLDSGTNSKWYPEYTKYFQGKTVVILPDNDKPGDGYAKQIHKNLPNSKILYLPGLGEKQDVFDWLKAGHTMEEIDELAASSISSEKPMSSHKKETQAEIIINLVEEANVVFFSNQYNEPCLGIPVENHTEVYSLESKELNSWLCKLYHEATGHIAKSEAIKQAVKLLEAQILFNEKRKINLSTRIAEQDGAFWYDLTNSSWQVIKVTANGWNLIDNPPILFCRYQHQTAQVIPKVNGDIQKIFQYINLKQNHLLFLCWLVSCFVPDIPHAMLVLYGEKGSAKSTACSLLKKIIDPFSLDNLMLDNDLRSLILNFQQHWFLPFDNVSRISNEISDTLCRVITGGGIQQRKLFTNTEDCIFNFQRCLAINGINNVADRADLLDRSLLIELERISDGERKEIKTIFSNFYQDLSSILGGVFDTLSRAMAIFPTVKLEKLPRMADFAKWGYAIGEALGGHGEQFLQEYAAVREIQNIESLQSDAVGQLILSFIKGDSSWSGLVSELLALLKKRASDYGINVSELPSKPNGLSRRLNNLKSNLKAVGISFNRHSTSRGTLITLTRKEIPPTSPYPLLVYGDNGDNDNQSDPLLKKDQENRSNEKK